MLAAGFMLCVTVCAVLFACKKNNSEQTGDGTEADDPMTAVSLSVFDGTSYTAGFVYDGDSHTAAAIKEKLTTALNDRFGQKPEFVKDSELAADSSAVEVLIGATDRAESVSCVDVGEHDAWYYAGVAGNKIVINGTNDYMLELAADTFIEKYLSGDGNTLVFSADMAEKEVWADHAADGWLLYEIPYYSGARVAYSMVCYDSGKMLTNRYDENAESAKMMIVTRTTRSEFDKYVERLKAFGYNTVATETLEDNVYVTMSNGSYSIHTYYTAKKNSVNVIYDKATALPTEISAGDAAATVTPAFYMYGLDHDPGVVADSGVTDMSVGLCLVARCADNSLVIIDGGAAAHMTGERGAKFNEFLHEITGTATGEKVTVRTWYLSHLHADHYRGFNEFIKQYYAQYELQSICTNINFGFDDAKDTDTSNFGNFLKTTYPNIKEVKLHTGQKISFAGASMQVLYTHEDKVNGTSGKNDISTLSLNHSSTVVKMDVGGMSVMILADAKDTVEECLKTAFTEATLKCDVVQIAHHAYDGVSKKLYEIIDADICLVPNSYGKYMERYVDTSLLEIYPELKPIIDGSTTYFAGKFEFTVGLAKIDGEIKVVCEPQGTPEYKEPEVTLDITKDSETKWNELESLGGATKVWRLKELPAYAGGSMSLYSYNSGTTITNYLDSDAYGAQMMLITNTDLTEFEAYVELLKTNGYTVEQRETLEGNVYVTLKNGENVVHTYFTANNSTARVILDKDTDAPSEVKVETPQTTTVTPTFFQYGLAHEGMNYPWSGIGYDMEGDVGMLYVGLCADNSVIIIDGGTNYQMAGELGKQLNDFLHEITNTPEGEKVTISCWFLSHLHSDHFRGFKTFIMEYYNEYELKSICTNIPFSFTEVQKYYLDDLREFSTFLNEKYPGCKEVKIHTGQKLEFAGITMQALHTHEDLVNATTGISNYSGSSMNNTSTVIKLTVNGMSVIILGDAYPSIENGMLSVYTAETLKCDVVQIAHHAYNGVSKALYDVIDADIVVVPCTYGQYAYKYIDVESVDSKYPNLNPVLEAADAVYFMGRVEFTVGLAVVDGEITVVYEPESRPTS